MAEIQGSGGPSIDDLAVQVGLNRSALSHHLRPLLYENALELVPSRNDQPLNHLKLTDKGERQLGHAEALWREARANARSAAGKASMPRLFGASISSITQEGRNVAA